MTVRFLHCLYAASILSTRVVKLMLHGCMDNNYRNDCWPATYSDWSCTLVYKITVKKTIVCTVKYCLSYDTMHALLFICGGISFKVLDLTLRMHIATSIATSSFSSY